MFIPQPENFPARFRSLMVVGARAFTLKCTAMKQQQGLSTAFTLESAVAVLTGYN